MKNIILINKDEIPHYRISVYNYLKDYLNNYDFNLTVVSEEVDESNLHTIRFPYIKTHLCFFNLIKIFIKTKPNAVILWINPQIYHLPVFILLKLLRIKMIHWGHRHPVRSNVFKTFYLNIEHWIDDAIILYAEHLRKYIWNAFQSKTFVANNTLNLTAYIYSSQSKEKVKIKYGIFTSKNIICMGRMQKRKRLIDLIQAFRLLNMEEVGLILVGPDSNGILNGIEDRNIFKLEPIYGDDSLDLLRAADIYCLPGAIGLSIVDAFYCGLPVVTENVFHGPEIMYLKNGINGFMVPKGDISQLAAKLRALLIDDDLRERFSQAAKNEIMTNGHIDRMCEGFRNALKFVCK